MYYIAGRSRGKLGQIFLQASSIFLYTETLKMTSFTTLWRVAGKGLKERKLDLTKE